MTDYQDRLSALRAHLTGGALDGMIVATGDEHLSEFTAPYAHRLAWLTGFTGSTATAVVLADAAAMFVDSRYTAAVRNQVDAAHWSFHDVPATTATSWLADTTPAASRIGYDARLHSHAQVREMVRTLSAKQIELVPLGDNPIDRLWEAQPPRPGAPAIVHPLCTAGKSSIDKRADVTQWLEAVGADACVIVALDSIAWLFNIRGGDIANTPVSQAFAICHGDGTAELFIAPAKIDAAVREHLGNAVALRSYEDFYPALAALGERRVSIDPNLSPDAVVQALTAAGAILREDRDPTILPKAIKNPAEIAAIRQAHRADSVALIRFLHWLAREAPKGGETELSAAARVTGLRREVPGFDRVSFDPISAVDANAALPHYWPTAESDTPIGRDSIYLIDSGGQYPGGTTDVTRTVAIGATTPELRDRFTRVLKGHINLATAVFPAGTMGSRLDLMARTALWEGGFECPHSIGHGIGQFLNVHEGPAYFRPSYLAGEEPLAAGMTLSNEPGYYREGEYGIRTENDVVVVERHVDGGDRPMLAFETLTLVPIDRALVEPGLMTPRETAWLDAYHARVFAEIGPLLDPDERAWLQGQTAPIAGNA